MVNILCMYEIKKKLKLNSDSLILLNKFKTLDLYVFLFVKKTYLVTKETTAINSEYTYNIYIYI
jgi:hypothetical protein